MLSKSSFLATPKKPDEANHSSEQKTGVIPTAANSNLQTAISRIDNLLGFIDSGKYCVKVSNVRFSVMTLNKKIDLLTMAERIKLRTQLHSIKTKLARETITKLNQEFKVAIDFLNLRLKQERQTLRFGDVLLKMHVADQQVSVTAARFRKN